MCDPISLIVAATVATGAAGYASSQSAAKANKRAAAATKAAAAEDKRNADLAARSDRNKSYQSRRQVQNAAPSYFSGAGLFSSRSFFQPAG